MRFRTDLLPALPIVIATSVTTLPLVMITTTGCKKQDKVQVDSGVPIVIQNRDDIPVMMGGAAVPMPPPMPTTSSSSNSKTPTAPHAAQGAQGAAAAEPQAAAAAAAAPAPKPTALVIAHNHPPDQPCKSLTKEEVEKALADLKSKQ